MSVIVRRLGQRPYAEVYQAMRDFTEQRDEQTPDELWWVEHPPTFTLGRAADQAHLLAPGDIPVVQTDRGGQVTYHGPGQVVIYLLLDLNRHHLGVQRLVGLIETSLLQYLAAIGIDAELRDGAPGVYVAGKKIGSLGLRIVQARSYHGLALNVDMDLQPFARINPCGYQGLEMTQVTNLVPKMTTTQVAEGLLEQLQSMLETDA